MSGGRNDRLHEALRDAPVPDDRQAEERGWRVVREAYTDREPATRRLGQRPRAALAVAATGLAAALALSPAGAEVGEWIADRIEVGDEDARPMLGSLPTSGSVLVESSDGTWALHEDGSRRRLGDYEHATWSSNGLYIGASEGRALFALTPQGQVRWTITAPRPIRALDWSTDEGFRVAYLAGRVVRVVAGDGTGDRGLARDVGSSALAWRPEASPTEARHQLAYVDRANRVVLENTDSSRPIWRSAPVPAPVESLEWSASGERLLIGSEGFAFLLDGNGQALFKGPVATGSEATLSPGGDHLAVVGPGRGGRAELTLIGTDLDGAERLLYPTAPGAGGVGFGKPTFSPDGEWVLLPWPPADQWIFIRIEDRRVVPVGDISRQLDSNRRGPASFPRVAGWCC